MKDFFEVRGEVFRRCMLRTPERELLSSDTQFGEEFAKFADTGVFVWSEIHSNWLFGYFDGQVPPRAVPAIPPTAIPATARSGSPPMASNP